MDTMMTETTEKLLMGNSPCWSTDLITDRNEGPSVNEVRRKDGKEKSDKGRRTECQRKIQHCGAGVGRGSI